MKKIIISVFCLFILTAPTVALAISPTPAVTVTPTEAKQSGLLDQINNLKDKIASKVAQLNLVEKRGLIGTVTEVTATQITINDVQDQTRFIDVDEITKFSTSSTKAGTFGISDITKGTVVTILGLYNKESRRLLARFVDAGPLPLYVSGHLTQIDKTTYTITIGATDKKTVIADIENITKTLSYSTDSADFIRSGFSKMTIGEKVIVIGPADKKEANRMTANKILLFPDIATAQTPAAIEKTPQTTPTASASAKNPNLIR